MFYLLTIYHQEKGLRATDKEMQEQGADVELRFTYLEKNKFNIQKL